MLMVSLLFAFFTVFYVNISFHASNKPLHLIRLSSPFTLGSYQLVIQATAQLLNYTTQSMVVGQESTHMMQLDKK